MTKKIIAPSVLAANLANLGQDVAQVLTAGADWIHFDVMDNHYVPNLTFGPVMLQALRKYGIQAPVDVHLMTQPVDELITSFAVAGANFITFHPEVSTHVDRSIQLIHDLGCKAGLAFNPATSLDYLKYVMDKIDLILLMSVNPGFGGQKFIPGVMAKIKETREMIKQSGRNIYLSVDGGINLGTIGQAAAQGANVFVAGTAIFGAKDYHKVIGDMRKAAHPYIF